MMPSAGQEQEVLLVSFGDQDTCGNFSNGFCVKQPEFIDQFWEDLNYKRSSDKESLAIPWGTSESFTASTKRAVYPS